MLARVILVHKCDRELIMFLPRRTMVVTIILLRIVAIMMLKPASETDLLYSVRSFEYNLHVRSTSLSQNALIVYGIVDKHIVIT
jgi:hypothetical protein